MREAKTSLETSETDAVAERVLDWAEVNMEQMIR